MSEIEVIIPTRKQPMSQCITGINLNTPPITDYNIVVDEGEGQTLIRYHAAKQSEAEYILILDDDISLRSNVVQQLLTKILDGYDAVCGEVVASPTGPFGKYVKQYMSNTSSFYPVGITLWCREKFIQIMHEMGVETTNFIADNLLAAAKWILNDHQGRPENDTANG